MAFEQKTWYNDGVGAPSGETAPCFSADNMNRIESGIDEALSEIRRVDEDIALLEGYKNRFLNESNNILVKVCDFSKKPTTYTILGNETKTITTTQDYYVSFHSKTWGKEGSATLSINDHVVMFSQGGTSSSLNINEVVYPPFFIKKGTTINLKTTGDCDEASISLFCCLQ